MATASPNLWQKTPLIYSPKLSEITGASIYLKLENLQPSYSFKYRGISHFIKKAKENHGPSIHLIIASGGNAGLAAACAAHTLDVKCSVVLPEGVAESTLDFLQREKAHVIVAGKHYAEALQLAQKLVRDDDNAILVPAYDEPLLWEGHSSMITEIKNELGVKPDAIFCSVGGGGLLGGIIVGCKNENWDDVPIIGLETIGSDCFHHSLSLNRTPGHVGEKKLPRGVDVIHNEENDLYLAHFNSFSSKASSSLGASQPSVGVMKMALERTGGIKSISVPDELSMSTLALFANDHKFLVELACSTTLVPAYHKPLFDKLVPLSDAGEGIKRVAVFVVCGGFKVSLTDVAEYQKIMEEDVSREAWTILGNDWESFSLER